MSSDWEKRERVKSEARRLALLIAVEYLVEDGVVALGGRLNGFSVSIRPEDYLMTLRVDFEGEAMIAFVGSDGIGNLFVKAAKDISNKKLVWREDKYRGG